MKISNKQLDLALLSLIILPYFLLYLGNMPLHTPDEARYSLISLEMWQKQQYLVPTLFGTAFLDKPPLFYYAQLLMLKIFGYSEFSLRLPSVLCAWLTCLVIYVTTRQLFCRITALYAASILATTPLFFAMAHYANLDMMVASFICWTLCFFILAQNNKERTGKYYMLAGYIAASLAFLSKGLIALVFPVGIIGLYCLFYRLKPKLYLIYGSLIVITMVAPWFWLMHNKIPGFSYYYFVIQHFYRYLSTGLNNQQPFWFYLAIIFGCSLPWFGSVIRVGYEKLKGQMPVIQNQAAFHYFLLAFIFILLFFSLPSSKTIGYILPTLPMMAVLLAVLVNSLNHQKLFFKLACLSLVAGLAFCYPWLPLQPFQHEIMPIAILLTLSGCAGLMIKLLFASVKPDKENAIKTQHGFVSLTLATLALLNLSGLKLVQSLEFQSIKPIANYLSHHNKKHFPIVMYQEIYYDLGHYATSKDLLLVDEWKQGLFKGDSVVEQFALGLQTYASTSFINNAKFSEMYQAIHQPFYILTNEANARSLVRSGSKLVLQHHGIFLLYREKS